MENFNNDFFVCIDYVGFVVKDMDEVIKYYCDVLGFWVFFCEKNEGYGVEEVMFGIGKCGEELIVVQLFVLFSEDSIIGKYIFKNKNMIQQVCYCIYNLDKMIVIFKECGVVFIGEFFIGIVGFCVIFFYFKYIGGFFIEIIEFLVGGMFYKD